MKIGFYGNANNYPFLLARAVQRLGHEVVFLVASRERLNRPEHLYSEISVPYPSWIVDVSGYFRWHCLVPGLGRREVLARLNACDAVILNEEGPALARHLQVPHGVLLTGSDIGVFADPSLAESLKPQAFGGPGWAMALSQRAIPTALITRRLVQPQRAGLRSARFVAFLPHGLVPNADRLLTEIGVDPARRVSLIFNDCSLVQYSPPPSNSILRVFSAARLTWIPQPAAGLIPLDLKGSDIMLRGLARFWRETHCPLDIHLVKKGRHIAEARQLAAELGIQDQITWHEEMNQREILDQFRAADIVLDQFAKSAVGMAGLDAMATGRPLIANGRPEILEPLFGVPAPICQAQSEEEVCAQLKRLVNSADERTRVGLASRAFVEKYFSADAAARRLLGAFGDE